MGVIAELSLGHLLNANTGAVGVVHVRQFTPELSSLTDVDAKFALPCVGVAEWGEDDE